MMKGLLETITTAGIAVGLMGCAGSTPPPSVQTGPNAEVTVDGLHRVDNSVMALAWVRPDLDLSGYTKVMLDDVTVAYQREPRARRQSPGGSDQNFALTPSQMENLKSWFREAVVRALTRDDGYEIVEAPGPDVLQITASLVDLVVRIPTEQGGSARTFASSYGEVTVILELRDSESEQVLARAADRRDPTLNPANELMMVTSAAVRRDTETLFNYWAGLLRESLDEIREVGIPHGQ